jgi:hypothetical protein
MVCSFSILSINTMKIPVLSQPALRAIGPSAALMRLATVLARLISE